MKLIFTDFNDLLEFNNVKINYTTLQDKKLILHPKNLKHQYIGYCSIINHNNNIKIYCACYNKKNKYQHDAKIVILNSINGINFNLIKILNNEGVLSSHFSVFHDTINYKRIGGVHTFSIEKFKNICKKKAGGHSLKCLKYSKNILYNKKSKLKIRSYKNNNPCKNNGLYISYSNDGINFNIIQKVPLNLKLQLSKIDLLKKFDLYDSQPSCIYIPEQKKYILYLRKNINTGIRNVQYIVSKDFINWTKPNIIKYTTLFNQAKDNYYTFKVIYYNTKYICFSNYINHKKKNGGVYLLTSNDGLYWKKCIKLLNEPISNHPSIQVFNGSPIVLNNQFHTYIKQDNKIYKYTNRLDSLFYITSKNGYIITKLVKIKDKIMLNYKCNKNGYIKVQLELNKIPIKNYTFDNCITLSEDSINQELLWNDPLYELECNIHIKLFNTNLYSIII